MLRRGPGRSEAKEGEDSPICSPWNSPWGWPGSAPQDHSTAGAGERPERPKVSGSGPGSSQPRVWFYTQGALASAWSRRSHLSWRTPDQTTRKREDDGDESKSREGRERTRAKSQLHCRQHDASMEQSGPVLLLHPPPPSSPAPGSHQLSSLTSPRGREPGEGEGRSRVSPLHAKQSQEQSCFWGGWGDWGPMEAHIPPTRGR